MLEIFPVRKSDINIGNFPLNHDCILKVVYFTDYGSSFQYFTCRAQDSGTLSLILLQLVFVNKVETISVDNF